MSLLLNWYSGPGATVFLATIYLIKIVEIDSTLTIRLFEGLVSFKKKGFKSNSKDVLLLRKSIEDIISDNLSLIVEDENI